MRLSAAPLLLLFTLSFCRTTQGKDAADSTNTVQRAPLVVMKQAEITGRVFLLSEEEGEDSKPARKLKVEISTLEKRTLLYETKTDDEGRYMLPNLDIGSYWMQVGLLRLELKVDDFPQATANTPIPKTILVYMPTSMAR